MKNLSVGVSNNISAGIRKVDKVVNSDYKEIEFFRYVFVPDENNQDHEVAARYYNNMMADNADVLVYCFEEGIVVTNLGAEVTIIKNSNEPIKLNKNALSPVLQDGAKVIILKKKYKNPLVFLVIKEHYKIVTEVVSIDK